MSLTETVSPVKSPVLAVAHTANAMRRYPGESVILLTRVTVDPALLGFRLQVILPSGLSMQACQALDQPAGTAPLTAWDEDKNYLIWNVVREKQDPSCYNYRIEAKVAPTLRNLQLESQAVLQVEPEQDRLLPVSESVTISVAAKGRYLKYLPAIYQDDELMGRFLMLFESFLGPVDHQIDSQAAYFDPKLAPPEFLPWLASWTNLTLDDSLPDDRRRMLLTESSALYKRRGTRQGLQRYLEIFTGGRVEIVEHLSENFILGSRATMGQGIALGMSNIPLTFTVNLVLPEESDNLSAAARERKIVSIIEAEKPVHTGYELHIDIDPALNRRD
jgi:phage tail-like protein